jgi:hypothetical protein
MEWKNNLLLSKTFLIVLISHLQGCWLPKTKSKKRKMIAAGYFMNHFSKNKSTSRILKKGPRISPGLWK